MDLPIVNDIVRNVDQTTVPTLNDDIVKVLRSLDQPITLFGEDNFDRRQRLLKYLSERPNLIDNETPQEDDELSDDDEDDEFYTPGTEDLFQARKTILLDSLQRAQTRIQKLKAEYDPDTVKNLKHRRILNSKVKYELHGTQLIPGNTRAISTVKCQGQMVACGSWDGRIYVLDKNMNLRHKSQLGHHLEKVTFDWKDVMVSGGTEGTINIWSPSDEDTFTPLTSLNQSHDDRITRVLIHPSSKYFVSTSFDQTWKLWDLETCQELMTQEGHLKQVLSASFHTDGGIIATGGMDCHCKLWDIRSGKLICNLSSHIQGIYSMDWSSNGVHLATGSGDCSIKIWDLRKLDNRYSRQSQGEVFSILAHKKLISNVKFMDMDHLREPVTDENDENPRMLNSDGKVLISSSYDGQIKSWSSDNWINISTLDAGDKVMNFDVAQTQLFSSHWDRSLKLWEF